jgi:hypothetical protein
MDVKTFYLAGETVQQGLNLDISHVTEFIALQEAVATNLSIVVPNEVGFQDKDRRLESLDEIKTTDEPISITVSGQPVRETPGPEGLPYLGSYLQSKFPSDRNLVHADLLCSIPRSSWKQPAPVREIWACVQINHHGCD